MVKRRKKTFDLGKHLTVRTFFRITGIEGNELFSKIASAWNEQGITNRQKTFIFKYFNNILGITTRTSHIAANGTRNCFLFKKKSAGTNRWNLHSSVLWLPYRQILATAVFCSMLPGNGNFRWYYRKKNFLSLDYKMILYLLLSI